MAEDAKPYRGAVGALLRGELDLVDDPLKMMLCGAGYTPDAAVHEFKSDVVQEIVGVGYTARGKAVTGRSLAFDDTLGMWVLQAATLIWTGASFSTRWGVLYKDTGVDATSRLVSYVDFGGVRSPEGTPFNISLPDGLFTVEERPAED